MARDSEGRATVSSLDGTRTITVLEFDEIFDSGSDEVDEFVNWSKAHRKGQTPGTAQVGLDLPMDLLDRLHAEADRHGQSRDDLLAEWVAERIRALAPARDHAAE